jgi:gamma-glutamylcyclotransferase (GGCT)/AIG2-like uncharacterized protein YtfP
MLGSPSPQAPSTTLHLFVYGSLLDPRRLTDVLERPHVGERLRAQLPDFERRASRVYDYPYIVPSAGHVVDGVLVMDLSPVDLQVLDRYEEIDGGLYVREVVEVTVWGCGPGALRYRAFTYVAGPTLLAAAAREV